MLGMDLYNQLADCGYWMMPESAYVARYMLLVSSLLLNRYENDFPATLSLLRTDGFLPAFLPVLRDHIRSL